MLSKENLLEQPEKNGVMKMPEGFSLITKPGEVFDEVNIQYPDNELSLRQAFPDKNIVDNIVSHMKEFRDKFPGTFNGILLGNPAIKEAQNGKINISAEKLHYYVYFAAHKERQVRPELGEQYSALSVAGVVYDKAKQCFYLSVRPKDSQEEPGKIDAPGGVLNPDYLDADPILTARDRFAKKLGLKDLDVKTVGIERMFDNHYSLYNLAMYAETLDQSPDVSQDVFAVVPVSEVEDFLRSDKLTTTAKGILLCVLGQEKFTEFGWGPEKINEIINS